MHKEHSSSVGDFTIYSPQVSWKGFLQLTQAIGCSSSKLQAVQIEDIMLATGQVLCRYYKLLKLKKEQREPQSKNEDKYSILIDNQI